MPAATSSGFRTKLDTLTPLVQFQPENKFYVLNIDPKEYVQNIADVGTRQKMTNLGFSVFGSTTSGTGFADAAKDIHQTQAILHAIAPKATTRPAG